MPLYKGEQLIKKVNSGSGIISTIWNNNLIVFEDKLPPGTVLFEFRADSKKVSGVDFHLFEVLCPTTQTLEITCVGGGAPVLGCVIDL